MKRQILGAAVIVAIFCTSCKVIGTLYPLSDNENDFLFKKELIGKWGETKSNPDFYQVDTVKGTKGKLYRVKMVSHEKEKETMTDTSWFLMRLMKISDNYFLDRQFDTETKFTGKEKDYSDWLVAKHFFCRLNFIDSGKIEMVSPDPDELIKLIDEKKIPLEYYILKQDDYLILNKPKELQKGLIESNKYPLLYKDKILLERLKQ